jgi:O-antigen/teichoic acid export membrane protein
LPPIITLFVISVFSIIYTNIDVTMLGVIKGDTDVGLYSTAVKVYTLVNSTVASVLVVVLPQLSYQFRQKNYDEINKLISYSVRFVMTAGIPCIVGIIAVADQIVAVVAGPDYISASEPLRILTVALLFSYMGGIVGNIILVPSGNEKVCLFSTGISAMMDCFASSAVMPRKRWLPGDHWSMEPVMRAFSLSD